MSIINKNKSRSLIVVAGFFIVTLLTMPFMAIKAHAYTYNVPVDVVLVIDRSGSMGGTPLSSEKTAASAFMDSMDSTQDQISVVAFDNSVSLQTLTGTFSTAKSFVNGINAGGGTDYLPALTAAGNELMSTRAHSGSMKVIVFMSDGVPNESSATILAKTTALKASGIQIFTIQLGSGDTSLLKSMASSSPGTDDHYNNAPTATQLAGIYVAIAGALHTPNVVSIGVSDHDLTLTSNAPLAPNKSVIIKAVNSTVTIASNQTNNPDNNGAGYKDISQLPQLVIIAKKIVISANVTNVDAWLVAKTVQTCDDYPQGKPTVYTCSSQLTVNGPIITDHLILLRTAGSCSPNSASNTNISGCSGQTGVSFNPGTPAEIFNLRADVYLWAAAHATTIDRAQTVYSVSLPPRF